MKHVLFVFAFALLTIAACGGTESTNADTSLTIDEVTGIWRVDAVDLVKDTCKFPDMDPGEAGEYSLLEKADATHLRVYGCEDAACTVKSEDPEVFAYSKGKMTIPGDESDLAVAGSCRVYMSSPQTYALFASASSGSMTMSATAKFEGDCTALKALSAGDDNYPDKTMGDYEGCQIQIKRTMSKQ